MLPNHVWKNSLLSIPRLAHSWGDLRDGSELLLLVSLKLRQHIHDIRPVFAQFEHCPSDIEFEFASAVSGVPKLSIFFVVLACHLPKLDEFD